MTSLSRDFFTHGVISPTQAPSLHKTVRDGGGHCQTVPIGHDRQPLPETGQLRLGTGEVTTQHLTRLSHINDLPAVYLQEWIPDDVCVHAEMAINVVRSVDETLREVGHDPVRAWCQASLGVGELTGEAGQLAGKLAQGALTGVEACTLLGYLAEIDHDSPADANLVAAATPRGTLKVMTAQSCVDATYTMVELEWADEYAVREGLTAAIEELNPDAALSG